MEELLRGGLLDSWQSELHELLANLSTTTGSDQQHRQDGGRSKKLHFQLQNCIDVSQETSRVSFMALPGNVILNVPIVASVIAEAPFTKEYGYFEVEVLSVSPDSTNSTLVVGAVQKGFAACQEPGFEKQSVGYRPADGSVHEEGDVALPAVEGASCNQGDKIGCGIETKEDDDFQYVYFTKNGERVFETPLDPTVEWYPAVSMSALKEEVRFLEETPWRSVKAPTDPHEGVKFCQETGHVSFRSNKPSGGRKDALLFASQPFARQFCFFEIEIIAMAETDEIAIGAVPEDYSHHMPGFRQRSCGFHARAGGIYAGRKKKADGAPKCQVGDKMGCGIEHRADGRRTIYFTHNSKSFMEAQVNDNCPARMFPAIGLSSKGTGTVSVCIMDPSNWVSPGDDPYSKHTQIDMQTTVDAELGTIIVDKDTARASYTAPVGVAKDAILVAETPLTQDHSHFEIELLYGSLMTLGLVKAGSDTETAACKHPGFIGESIGYNAETGQVYIDGKSVKDIGKSTYGDRVRCGARVDPEGKQLIYFRKNGKILCELPFDVVPFTGLSPAVAMRSAGGVLALRLLDRKLWDCEMVEENEGSSSSAMLQLVDREVIECPICRDVLSDPRILPCSIHTFCAGCLQSYVAQHAGRRSMPCPVCRSVFTLPPGGVTELPVNTIVTRLLEVRSKFSATASSTSAAAAAAEVPAK